jgi:hypothetical protein
MRRAGRKQQRTEAQDHDADQRLPTQQDHDGRGEQETEEEDERLFHAPDAAVFLANKLLGQDEIMHVSCKCYFTMSLESIKYREKSILI